MDERANCRKVKSSITEKNLKTKFYFFGAALVATATVDWPFIAI